MPATLEHPRGRGADAAISRIATYGEVSYLPIRRARGAELGITVVTLNDGHAYEQLHDLLVYGGWTCDRHPVYWNWAGAVA